MTGDIRIATMFWGRSVGIEFTQISKWGERRGHAHVRKVRLLIE